MIWHYIIKANNRRKRHRNINLMLRKIERIQRKGEI